MNKKDAISQIISLMLSQDLSIEDITNALPNESTIKERNIGAIRVFAYIGGVFILSGISAFVAMHWFEISSLMRVLCTLGIGFVCFLAAVKTSQYESLINYSAPLFVVAALLETAGLYIYIYEYFGPTTEFDLEDMVVFGLLFTQFIGVFFVLKHQILCFLSLVFATIFMSEILTSLHINDSLSIMMVGLMLFGVTIYLENTRFKTTSPFWFLSSSAMLLGGLFSYIYDTPYEILILLISCCIVYASVWARSRILLIVSSISIFSYLVYFTEQHFVESIGWPIALIGLGFLLFFLSFVAFKINKFYIQTS